MPSANGLTILLPKRLTEAGGTSTFARNFQNGMTKRGHTVVFDWQPEYGILLASPTVPLRHLLHAKLHRRPIVHRLDGVYYPGSSANSLWRILNWQLSLIRSFADAIVYQSEYSRVACEQRLVPLRRSPKSSIIYNGVDIHHFSPRGKQAPLRDNPGQQIIISASRFRTDDQIIPLLKTFSMYCKQNKKNAKLILIGPFEERVARIPQQHRNTSGVTFLGSIPHAQLPHYLRAADIFLLTHKTPPCPNNVLEAMACGLPICGIADGAMPELVTSGTEGELVAEPSPGSPFPTPSLASALAQIAQKKNTYATRARQRIERDFTLERMLDQYDALVRTVAQSQTR